MYNYAQIDNEGFLISLSQLSGEVDSPVMVPMTLEDMQWVSNQFEFPRYLEGEWIEGINDIPRPTPIPEEDELEIEVKELQDENASLWYDVLLKKGNINKHEDDVAEMWYEIMMGGMLDE